MGTKTTNNLRDQRSHKHKRKRTKERNQTEMNAGQRVYLSRNRARNTSPASATTLLLKLGWRDGQWQRKWTIFNGWTKWKSWKFSFSRNARIHGSRHRAGNRCHAMPWRQQSRTAQTRGARMTRQRCAQQTRQRCAQQTRRRCAQKTSSYITARPWLPGLIVGPCPSDESLCCPAGPPPFFRRFSAPSL